MSLYRDLKQNVKCPKFFSKNSGKDDLYNSLKFLHNFDLRAFLCEVKYIIPKFSNKTSIINLNINPCFITISLNLVILCL